MENATLESKRATVAPLFQEDGNKKKCRNHIGICLLRTHGELYISMIVQRARDTTQNAD
jgi:hypothetical protein